MAGLSSSWPAPVVDAKSRCQGPPAYRWRATPGENGGFLAYQLSSSEQPARQKGRPGRVCFSSTDVRVPAGQAGDLSKYYPLAVGNHGSIDWDDWPWRPSGEKDDRLTEWERRAGRPSCHQ